MKVVGWTNWDNTKYRNLSPSEQENREYIDAIIAELRSNRYMFSGTYHQEGEYGCPVFEDGSKFAGRTRCWGRIMAEAFPSTVSHACIGLTYVIWAWLPPDGIEQKIPSDRGLQ